MCVLVVSGVSLVDVSLLSADVAVAVVRPEVIIISASFYLQSSNKDSLESSGQGAHDHAITPKSIFLFLKPVLLPNG
jgi:hypothetical protein